MKKAIGIGLVVVVLCNGSFAQAKTMAELIRDLGVQDQGNHTCNTACSILMSEKDEAIAHLKKALVDSNKRVRYYAVRCLGSINTEMSRATLIRAFLKGKADVREHAAYALTWDPHQDAEAVYIEFLSGQDRWHVRHAVKALGEIKSQKALAPLKAIRDDPEGWHFYYAALKAIRRIESKELPEKIRDALQFLRKAKYSRTVDDKQLSASESTVKRNIEIVLPDIMDIYLWVTKGNESKVEPNSKTILRDAGKLDHPGVSDAPL